LSDGKQPGGGLRPQKVSGSILKPHNGFLEGLKNNLFKWRVTEDISVTLLEDRALAALIIVAERKDGGSLHRYRNIRLFSRAGALWVIEHWYNYEITAPRP